MTKNASFTRGEGLLEGYLAKKRAKLANSFISDSQREGKILDIGCGYYPYFLTKIKFKEKYGIDPSVNSKLVSEQDISLIKESFSGKKLDFKDNFFDVVVMLAVFEHIEENLLPTLLREVHRILKKRGTFILTTPSPWSDKLLHTLALYGLISSEEIHDHKHNHPKPKINMLIKNAGFNSRDMRSGFFELTFNMWFVARK